MAFKRTSDGHGTHAAHIVPESENPDPNAGAGDPEGFDKALHMAGGYDPETGEVFGNGASGGPEEPRRRVLSESAWTAPHAGETSGAGMLGDGEIAEAEVESIRIEPFIKMNMFAPNKNYMSLHCLQRGVDWREEVAELIGVAWSHKRTKFRDEKTGAESESVELTGDFRAQSYLTGEVIKAPVAYLPMMWARQVEGALAANANAEAQAIMHLVIGYAATGKQLPFRWTVEMKAQAGAVMSQADALWHRAMGTKGAQRVKAAIAAHRPAALTHETGGDRTAAAAD